MRNPLITETKDFSETDQNYPGGEYYYIETDLQLLNILTRHKPKYGKEPFVFYKYIKVANIPGFERKDQKLYLRSATSTMDLLGTEFEKSDLCGKETTGPVAYLKQGVETYHRSWAPDLSVNVTRTNYRIEDVDQLEIPKLERAGEVNMAYLSRARGETSGGYTFDSLGSGVGISIGTDAAFNYNLSSAKLIEIWNEYIALKNRNASSSELAVKQLRFRDSFGKDGVIDNFGDFQRLFPKHFLIAGENFSYGFAALIGEQSVTRVDGKLYPTSYVGLWQKYAAEGLSEKAIVEHLRARGYTQAQINATRLASGQSAFDARQFAYNTFSESALVLAPLNGSSNPNNPTPGGGSTNGNGGVNGGAKGPKGLAWTGPEGYEPGQIQSITVSRSRNSFVTSEALSSIITADPTRQIMYQVYAASIASDGTTKYIIEQYPFDFSPNDINYSNLAGEWQSIERSGSFPIIDWKSFKLLQISFSFLIANKTQGQLTADGLDSPVTQQIEKLQRMAQKPYPVVFYGFDTLLTNQFRYDSSGKPRGIQFVIQDLSIASQRRNERMEITRAQATITLQEIPVETTNIIGMPRLTHKNPPPPKIPVPVTDPDYALFEKGLAVQNPNTLTFTN